MTLANRIIPVEKRRIAARDVIEFTVPICPPLNSLYANVPGKGRIKSRKYRDWIKEAGWVIAAARLGGIDGPVKVDITLQDGMRGDTDGRIKALLDMAVRHGLIEDDAGKIIRDLSITFGPVIGAKVVIRRAV